MLKPRSALELSDLLRAEGIKNERVLEAIANVPREEFVPPDLRHLAYLDMPLEIGEGQTISQPYVVAFMTELLDPKPGEKILEVGTGSGYQACILAYLGADVVSVERIKSLFEKAKSTLERLGVKHVKLVLGDGSRGYPQDAPYDGIIVTAGAKEIPKPLLHQLKEGGRLVIPVGDRLVQDMWLVKKEGGKAEVVARYPGFRFVPLVGEWGYQE